MTDGMPGGERRPEIEIIPPDRPHPGSGRAHSRVWISLDTRDGRFRTPGLFSVILSILGFTFVATIVLMIFLGALLIWVPVIAVAVAGLLIAGLLRARFQRGGHDVDGPGRSRE